MMKLAKKLLLFACILTLCLGFTLTAQAADRQFKKQTVFFKEGQSKNLTLLNSETTPEVLYYDADSALFSYQVKGASSIRITANRPGIDYITVKNDGENISCCLVILPKNNPAVKTRVTKKGNTVVTYKKARVVLPRPGRSMAMSSCPMRIPSPSAQKPATAAVTTVRCLRSHGARKRSMPTGPPTFRTSVS